MNNWSEIFDKAWRGYESVRIAEDRHFHSIYKDICSEDILCTDEGYEEIELGKTRGYIDHGLRSPKIYYWQIYLTGKFAIVYKRNPMYNEYDEESMVDYQEDEMIMHVRTYHEAIRKRTAGNITDRDMYLRYRAVKRCKLPLDILGTYRYNNNHG
jgi:hypothetical protein